ncbi:testis-expressed protein 264 homolog [Ciona intestinalis]
MEYLILLILIAITFLCLISTVLYLLVHVGIFGNITVSVGKPVIQNVCIGYKTYNGSYKNCGANFSAAFTLFPQLQSIGIYYENPYNCTKDPTYELDYAVGLILAEGDQKPDPKVVKTLEKEGYKMTELPAIEYAVQAKFPLVFDVCSVIGSWRVYPILTNFINKKRLSAHPYIEIYTPGTIHYLAPLSKQSDFFVPGVSYKPDNYVS